MRDHGSRHARSSRRRFLAMSAGVLGAARLTAGPATAQAPASRAPGPALGDDDTWHPRPGGSADGFDPWMEVIGDAFRHNVAEVSRLASGRPLLAVIKNNAYGIGDRIVGPLVAGRDEVAGLACVRVAEALAMREAGVTKPILNMAEVSEREGETLARHDVHQAVWLDDAPDRLARIATRTGKPVPVHLYLDAGMNREGMPLARARPWVEALCTSDSVRVDGTFMMFPHVLEANRPMLDRFLRFTDEARQAGLDLGRLHAAPSYEVQYLPDSHLDMVRPGNLLFGNYRREEWLDRAPDLRTVFRLRARVVRLERLRTGDTASFGRGYVATRPTWIALLPTGHVDGYPASAANACEVLVNGRLYPVVATVSSTHTLLEIGDERSVEVGDAATLIGPDDPAITPHEVAERAGIGFYTLITKMNAFLPKRLV